MRVFQKGVERMTVTRADALGIVRDVAQVFTIEADIREGLPETTFVGLPDTDVREMRDRVRAGIINSGEAWPSAKLTIKLAPRHLTASISSLDLAIAIAVLAAAREVPRNKLASTLFVAELGLDGRLRPAPGLQGLPTVVRHTGLSTLGDSEWYAVVTATEHAGLLAEAAGKKKSGVTVSIVVADHLRDVAAWLRGSVSPAVTFL
jgi:magnesium chelatase family protein